MSSFRIYATCTACGQPNGGSGVLQLFPPTRDASGHLEDASKGHSQQQWPFPTGTWQPRVVAAGYSFNMPVALSVDFDGGLLVVNQGSLGVLRGPRKEQRGHGKCNSLPCAACVFGATWHAEGLVPLEFSNSNCQSCSPLPNWCDWRVSTM